MTLADLIRGNGLKDLATVTVATVATEGPSVAEVASVAVATSEIPISSVATVATVTVADFEVDFAERVAILIEDGEHNQADAHRLALEEIGGDRLPDWRVSISAIPDRPLQTLATAFLKSASAAVAASLGWDELDLFGVFHGPPAVQRRRLDAAGLIPALAWSHIGAKLAGIEEDRAIIIAASGSRLTWLKQRPGRRYAVPVWEV